MSETDVVVYKGLNLIGQFDAVFNGLSEQGVAAFALGQPVRDAGFIIGAFELEDEIVGTCDPSFLFAPRTREITTIDVAC